jgi:WD40 repeat protein
VAFSNDGQCFASGSSDETVKIWDATSGACLQTLLVGRNIYRCSFDPLDNSRLLTDDGIVDLETSKSTSKTSFSITEISGFDSYGLDKDGVWIMKEREKALRLPLEYRPTHTAVTGSSIALGCRSGRVLIIGFKRLVKREQAGL